MKFNFDIINLDCASCSVKIERAINSSKEIVSCDLDFINKKLQVETHQDFETQELINFLENIIHIFEKEVTLEVASDNKKTKSEKKLKKEHINFILWSISLVVFILLSIFKLNKYVELAFYVVAYLLVSYDVIFKTFNNIRHLNFMDENFLMTIASVGAFAIGQFGEGVMVMLLYNLGESFQNFAVDKSKKQITSLVKLKCNLANIILNGEEHTISPEKLKVGDIIIVKSGEKVPVDSVIIKGESKLDTSSLTGESKPKKVGAGDLILSGCVNLNGLIVATVNREYKDSTIAKVLMTLESASGKKAKSEKFITKFARVYTPVVLACALLVAIIPPIFVGNFVDWLYKALIFLVVSCPCALVISVPLAFFGGVGACSKIGVLIKGTTYLESLSQLKTLCFDKTGTLTTGKLDVSKIILEDGVKEDFFVKFLCYIESGSNHPLASSVKKLYSNKIFSSKISEFQEFAGKGVKGIVEGREVIAGSKEFLKENNFDIKEIKTTGSIIYLAVEGKYLGCVLIEDVLRKEVKENLAKLHEVGLDKFVMLTGDNEFATTTIAKSIAIDEYYFDLLPHEKVEKMEDMLKTSSGKVAYVGDGINDAPILKRSDVGIAMGKFGSDIAIESADVVLMDDDLGKLTKTIRISKKTRAIALENVIFSVLVKVAIMVLSLFGLTSMWWAVFGDVGVMVLCVLNTFRLLLTRKKKKEKNRI